VTVSRTSKLFSLKVQGSGFRVQGSRFRVQGSRFKVQGSEFKVQSSRFRVQGSGFRVQSSGFRVQGSEVNGLAIFFIFLLLSSVQARFLPARALQWQVERFSLTLNLEPLNRERLLYKKFGKVNPSGLTLSKITI
jgi:hypothetical protein